MRIRWLTLGGLLLTGLATAGCHELQPHRLQRLNRSPGLSTDAYYSIADPRLPDQAAAIHGVQTESHEYGSVSAPAESAGTR